MGCVLHRMRIQPENIVVRKQSVYIVGSLNQMRLTLVRNSNIILMKETSELPRNGYLEYVPPNKAMNELRYSAYANLLENPHLNIVPVEKEIKSKYT